MSENEPKKETVRITLPTRPAVGEGGPAAPVKKETVRINLPSRPTLGSAASTPMDAPKKESAKLSNLAKPPVLPPKPMAPPPPGAVPRPAPAAAGAPPSTTAPLRPPPGAPGSMPSAPRPAAPAAAGLPSSNTAPLRPPPAAPGSVPSASRPLAPAGGPPKPPGAPGAPMVPRPPGAPMAPGAPKPPGSGGSITRPLAPAPGAPKPPGAPVSPLSTAETSAPETAATAPLAKKPVPALVADDAAATVVSPTPKKDTVRIEVPKKAPAAAPQNTVRMQTQPLQPRPAAAEVRALPVSSTVVTTGDSAEEDPVMKFVPYGVLAFSALVLLFQILNYVALSAN